MFVLPPPPRYPSASPYNPTGAPLSSAIPTIETANTFAQPSGLEYQLLAGEGTYVLRDDIHLATPPPHPSDTPMPNPNPLATTVHEPVAGTRVSLVKLGGAAETVHENASKTGSARMMGGLYKVSSAIAGHSNRVGALQNLSLREESREGQQRSSGEDSHPSDHESNTPSSTDNKVLAAGETHPQLAPAFGEGVGSLHSKTTDTAAAGVISAASPITSTKDTPAAKRKKPKSNLVKTNSAFISRVILHDRFGSRIQERERDGGGWMGFANINRAFHWLDLSEQANGKKAEPITKILMTKAHPLCHDINQVTRCQGHLDVIIGFSTGDIMWYEPFSTKYTRLNKNGHINPSPVSTIRWLPGSENLFVAAHTDGSLVVYDKEKDDGSFVPEEPVAVLDEATSTPQQYPQPAPPSYSQRGRKPSMDPEAGLRVNKSVHSRNQKTNPVAWWRISNQRINGYAFSPDCTHLAVVSEDGTLRILDYLREKYALAPDFLQFLSPSLTHPRLLHIFSSYYGGLTCVCFSPDGRYILTGGQDDLVSIFSLSEARIVARCHGHHSWVSAVAFDRWRCDERNYRFGSVGEDCRLLLWDFSEGMLVRPRTAAAGRHRASVASGLEAPPLPSDSENVHVGSHSSTRPSDDSRKPSGGVGHDTASDSGRAGGGLDEDEVIRHPIEARMNTATLPPVLSKVIDPNPLCGLEFLEDAIVTTCEAGHIRTWDRPTEGSDGEASKAAGTESL